MIIEDSTQHPVQATIIDRPGYYLKINEGVNFIEFVIKADTVLDEITVRDSKKVLEELAPGKKHFLLVSSEGFFRVTKRARKLGASKNFSAHLAAVSCYSNNLSLFLIGELYNKINKPAVPTRAFLNRESAEEWLAEQITKSHNTAPGTLLNLSSEQLGSLI